MIIGIDATNITEGGGINHIKNILNLGSKELYKFNKIIIWANTETLKYIKPKKNLKKIDVAAIHNKPIQRFIWQMYYFENELKRHKCDHALILGGIFFFKNIPATIIMQNLLPFDEANIKKYRYFKKLKFFLQKKLFLKSMLTAKNIIFLSKSSKNAILKSLNIKIKNFKIIPHGIENKIIKKKLKKNIFFKKKKKFKILYVSKIEFYKNQIDLLKVGYELSKKKYNFLINFIGPAYEPALKKFLKFQKIYDPNKNFTKYLGNRSFRSTLKSYKENDLHVVPSTCETFGQIVLEAMACGIPNACSNIDVFREITGNNALFFKKNNIKEMVRVIERLMISSSLRYKLSRKGTNYLKKHYSWQKTSQETFKLIGKF